MPSSGDADPRMGALAAALERFERRFRLQEAATLAPWVAAAVVGVVALIALYWRLTGNLSWVELGAAGAGLLVVGMAAALAYALLRPRDPLATALRADLSLGLDERLSTALEDAGRPPARPNATMMGLRDAQLDDALRSVERVNAARDLPVRIRRERFVPVGVLVLVLLAVVFFPNLASSAGEDTANEQIATEQRNIEVLKEAIETSPNATDPALQKVLQELELLSHDLKEGDLTQEEALARLSETEAELQKALDPQVAAERQAMEGLADQLSSSGDPNLQRAGDALKNDDPQKSAEELKHLADSADKMTPEARKALADELREARDAVASLDPELASRLEDAASALENADPEAAKDALNNLSDKVEQTGQNLATQKQIEQSLAQIQASKENIASTGQPTPTSGGTAVAGTPAVGGTPGTPSANGTAVALGSPMTGSPVAVGTLSGSPVARASGTLTPVAIAGTAQAGSTATAGTPVAAGNGQGQGQGNGNGQGQGQGNGNGQGQQGQQGQGGGQGQGNGQGNGQGSNVGPPAGGWGTGHNEPVYVPPSSVEATLTPVSVQGQDNPGGEQSTAPTNTDANSIGPSVVPYENVYGEYKEQAGTALDSDYIPQGYKDLVRDYFNQIEPR